MEEAEIISEDKLSVIKKFMDVKHINNYIQEFPKYDSIIHLQSIYELNEEVNNRNINNENGHLITKNEELIYNLKDIINYIENFNKNNVSTDESTDESTDKKKYYTLNVYFTYNQNGDDNNIVLYSVFTRNDNNSRIVCLSDINSWISTIDYWNSKKYTYER
jgi:uncharacterized protein YrzB (UPF0473 family)